MSPALALGLSVTPALGWLSSIGVASDWRAKQMLLAIGGQESGFAARRQGGGGPARGFWQFEKGGVGGVLEHRASQRAARLTCEALLVPPAVDAVHAALEQNDLLACAFARLLLFTDPAPLPGEPDQGWLVYARCWRPGKPRPADWPENWRAAARALEAARG